MVCGYLGQDRACIPPRHDHCQQPQEEPTHAHAPPFRFSAFLLDHVTDFAAVNRD